MDIPQDIVGFHGKLNAPGVVVVSILKQDTSCKSSLRGKRLIAGWDDEVLLKILAAFSTD